MSEDPVPAPDLTQLLAEIDDEVARRRASGEIPATLEDELQNTFARHSPPPAPTNDLSEAVSRVRQAAHIDTTADLESSRPGVAEAKRFVRKAIAFQVRHVASQVSHLGHVTADALDGLADRLAVFAATEEARHTIAAQIPPVDGSWLPVADIVDVLSGVAGRVLHLGAAGGEVVLGAVAAGVDAYGVEADARISGGIDALTRTADPVSHLASVADEALGAVVLSVETADVVGHHRLAGEAVRATRRGGRVVVVTRTAPAWAADVSPAVADLALGRPLHPETWSHLLGGMGVVDLELLSVDGGRCAIVTGTRR